MSDSFVKTIDGKAVSFVGEDAVRLFQAIALRSSIALYAKAKIIPTRGVGPAAMLSLAGKICGKQYRRGQYDLAVQDLTTWIEAMKLAMPVEAE